MRWDDEAVYRVTGSFAERATSVRQRGSFFEVGTGMLEPDAHFAPHGHLVRFEIVAGE